MSNIINNIDQNISSLSDSANSKFKDENEQKKVTILYSPILKVTPMKLTKDDLSKIESKPLGKELLKFRKKLYRKFNNQNLKLLNNNLASLEVKIKYITPQIFLSKFFAGTYNAVKNKLTVLKILEEITSIHEFFHIASSYYDENHKIAFSGFQQIIFEANKYLGSGLNEGYTELLTRRYLNLKNSYVTYRYDLCAFFTEKLEEIVGKERMETFYFNADLFGLYKYLTRFDDGSNVATFITTLDYLFKTATYENSEEQIECYELIECYLYKWFIMAKQEELNKHIIDENTFNKETQNYINSFGNESLCSQILEKQKEYCLK